MTKSCGVKTKEVAMITMIHTASLCRPQCTSVTFGGEAVSVCRLGFYILYV